MSKPGPKLVVYGAGGHARVLIDLLEQASLGSRLLGLVDDRVSPGTQCAGFPVLGRIDWLRSHTGVAVVLGVGDNQQRARIARACEELGLALFTAVHPRAIVTPRSELGDGSVVFAGAVINSGARIGKGCIVNSGAVVEHDCLLGDFSHVSPNATLGGGAQLGQLSHLGLGACVLPGVTVGDACTIGAGGVVVRPIPAGSVAYGVPASVQRSQT
jgi:sugar O-acyltransferase (sialic acid O-acetyltransferase NeuD family)